MERTVKVFVIPKERVPGGPPRPARALTVQAATVDGLREAARAKLAANARKYPVEKARGLAKKYTEL